MKYILTLITVLLISFNGIAQTTPPIPGKDPDQSDTVYTTKVMVALDTLQYQNLITFMEQFQLNNKPAIYILNLFNGTLGNVRPQKFYELKPKKQVIKKP